jgi:hypothetical protein
MEMARPPLVPLGSPDERLWFSHCQYPVLEENNDESILMAAETESHAVVPGYAAEVGEVEDGAAVAGVDDGVQLDAAAERPDNGRVDVVVEDDAAFLEVHRAERLVVAVHLVAVGVQLLHAVAGEVEHQGVTGARALHEPPHRLPEVVLGRHLVRVLVVLCPHRFLLIVDTSETAKNETYITPTCHDEDAVAGEVEPLAEQVAHAVDVVDGALELVRGAGVADPDEERALLPAPPTDARVARRKRVQRRRRRAAAELRLPRRHDRADEALDEADGGVVQAARAARDGVAERAPNGARAAGDGHVRAAAAAHGPWSHGVRGCSSGRSHSIRCTRRKTTVVATEEDQVARQAARQY